MAEETTGRQTRIASLCGGRPEDRRLRSGDASGLRFAVQCPRCSGHQCACRLMHLISKSKMAIQLHAAPLSAGPECIGLAALELCDLAAYQLHFTPGKLR